MKLSLSDWLFPSYCVLCQSQIHSSMGLCQFCLDDLPLLDLAEHDNLFYRPDIVEMFPNCNFEKLFACAFYQPPFDLWLKQLKFNNQIHYKKALQQVIKKQLSVFMTKHPIAVDAFIILPLHKARFLTRGFNQVTQVWQPCLGSNKVLNNALLRHKYTSAQSQLSKAKRVKNLQQAFSCKINLEGKTVVIIDDIMTTGATLNAATLSLKEAGAKHVWAFTTCLTPL
ncbi:Ribose-phosphate pyrophosphokinase [Pseudoalteromonas sp. P1-16-1b]|uniref:ComF family protein n=1 Tax=unclassified Pseudoalteromonas TaxID=194690 RepID=UPI0006D67F57|nr:MULTISPECIES: phosphoribosyltransferase family protein [unclassified Pseudoalteromonas]KPZ64608.1 Ribose-phosphate pyrophosphokinase [Pseudoalteromonas sp. P1-16-1b]PWS53477.1 ComF family protein [Pseudoalteromonas sp. meg-B1]